MAERQFRCRRKTRGLHPSHHARIISCLAPAGQTYALILHPSKCRQAVSTLQASREASGREVARLTIVKVQGRGSNLGLRPQESGGLFAENVNQRARQVSFSVVDRSLKTRRIDRKSV